LAEAPAATMENGNVPTVVTRLFVGGEDLELHRTAQKTSIGVRDLACDIDGRAGAVGRLGSVARPSARNAEAVTRGR